jgi:hypothetical protein
VEYAIEFGGAPQDVTITTSGPATPEALTSYVRDLVNDLRFRPGMLILADHSELDLGAVTPTDVGAQSAMMNQLDEQIGPCKIAIVVPSEVGFGYARMYQSHTSETQVDSQVFHTRADALAWLESERASLAS